MFLSFGDVELMSVLLAFSHRPVSFLFLLYIEKGKEKNIRSKVGETNLDAKLIESEHSKKPTMC